MCKDLPSHSLDELEFRFIWALRRSGLKDDVLEFLADNRVASDGAALILTKAYENAVVSAQNIQNIFAGMPVSGGTRAERYKTAANALRIKGKWINGSSIARELGISRQTVSVFLRSNRDIAEDIGIKFRDKAK